MNPRLKFFIAMVGFGVAMCMLMGCRANQAKHCGEIVMAQQSSSDFGPVAWIAIKGDDGIMYQEEVNGLWHVGMRTCESKK